MRDAAGQPVEIVGSWADISDRKQVEQALGERVGRDAGPADARRRQSVGHLHQSGLGQLRMHVRQREPAIDHGVRPVGDARRSEVLVQASPSGRCSAGVRRARPPDRPGRRERRVPLPASEGPLRLDPGHLHGHPRRGRQAEGARRVLGGHLRPQAGRGRVAATRRAGRAAEPVHSRDLRALPDRRGGRQSAGVPHGTADGRREAQGHDDDDRPPGLHVAVRATGAGTGRRHPQSLSDDHGADHQAVQRHHRRVHRRRDLRPLRGSRLGRGRRAAGGGLRGGDAAGHDLGQRAESSGGAARPGDGYRCPHGPGGAWGISARPSG